MHGETVSDRSLSIVQRVYARQGDQLMSSSEGPFSLNQSISLSVSQLLCVSGCQFISSDLLRAIVALRLKAALCNSALPMLRK